MGAADVDPREQRVLVLTPDKGDAELLRSVLLDAGVEAEFFKDPAGLLAAIDEGAGTLVVDEEVLGSPAAPAIAESLRCQPRWSDLPLVVIATARAGPEQAGPEQGGADPGGADPGGAGKSREAPPDEFGEGTCKIALVERPIHAAPLLTAVRAALRTRRRQYELRDLLAEAERAVRQRDEFLAMLGHELRNPLGVISSAVQILNRVGSPAREAAETRDMIERQASHLTRLVDDLLDVSRVSSGKILLKREPVDLNEVARQCFQSCEALVTARRHDVTFSPSPHPVLVDGDPVRLEQIINNLLTNSIKYTPAGGRIVVSVAREHEHGGAGAVPAGHAGHAVVRVRDNGMGIQPDMLVRVFDMFTQADRSLDRAQGGVGMGLTLVRRLVEMHGGTVSAASDGLGRGSEFAIRLPALPVTSPAGDASSEYASDAAQLDGAPVGPTPRTSPTSAPPADRPAQKTKATPRHVLIIEDGPDARHALGRLLELWGHHVELAEDGTRGVEQAIASRPEVALIDIGLPGLNGYEVARRVRQVLGNRIRLIALTGYGQPDDHERTREAGFDQHLVKPVNPKLLSRLLAENPAGASRPDPRPEAPSEPAPPAATNGR